MHWHSVIADMSDRTARISASIEEDIKQELRVEAAKRGISMSELVYIILHSHLSEDGDCDLPDSTNDLVEGEA